MGMIFGEWRSEGQLMEAYERNLLNQIFMQEIHLSEHLILHLKKMRGRRAVLIESYDIQERQISCLRHNVQHGFISQKIDLFSDEQILKKARNFLSGRNSVIWQVFMITKYIIILIL
jgi:chromosome segregation ATPase